MDNEAERELRKRNIELKVELDHLKVELDRLKETAVDYNYEHTAAGLDLKITCGGEVVLHHECGEQPEPAPADFDYAVPAEGFDYRATFISKGGEVPPPAGDGWRLLGWAGQGGGREEEGTLSFIWARSKAAPEKEEEDEGDGGG
jgi:hypothetical protein